jgi:hypothetical protein
MRLYCNIIRYRRKRGVARIARAKYSVCGHVSDQPAVAMQHMPAQKRCLPASSMANSSKNAVLAVCYLLPNPTILPRPYPVSLKSTKLASLRLATKLPEAQGSSKYRNIYKIEALGAQERRRGVVCIRRQ